VVNAWRWFAVPCRVGSRRARFCFSHALSELKRSKDAYLSTAKWKQVASLTKAMPDVAAIEAGLRSKGRSDAEVAATLQGIKRKVGVVPLPR
jgi:hypothetical protein